MMGMRGAPTAIREVFYVGAGSGFRVGWLNMGGG